MREKFCLPAAAHPTHNGCTAKSLSLASRRMAFRDLRGLINSGFLKGWKSR
jgi:hypothetical protein